MFLTLFILIRVFTILIDSNNHVDMSKFKVVFLLQRFHFFFVFFYFSYLLNGNLYIILCLLNIAIKNIFLKTWLKIVCKTYTCIFVTSHRTSKTFLIYAINLCRNNNSIKLIEDVKYMKNIHPIVMNCKKILYTYIFINKILENYRYIMLNNLNKIKYNSLFKKIKYYIINYLDVNR